MDIKEEINMKNNTIKKMLMIMLSAIMVIALAACGGGGDSSAEADPSSRGTDLPLQRILGGLRFHIQRGVVLLSAS